MAAYEQQLV